MSFDAPPNKTWLDPPDWLQDAACRSYPTEDFFLPDADFETARTARNAEKLLPGLKVCRSCPVASECLEEALRDTRLDVGIRGGTTALERRQIRRKQKGFSALV